MWQWLEKLIYEEKKINYSNQTIYQANDPSTPDLRINIPLPQPPKPLQINVRGFVGGVNTWGTPESDAATTYVTIAKLLEYVQNLFHNPTKWAAVRILEATPRAGKQLNAYYDRKGVRFFYDQNPQTRKLIYLCESSDIVAHEVGHALLDALRPDFWNVGALEIWSFHEAFADITALVATAQFTPVIEKTIKETGGNLRRSNTLSKLAEEVGSALGVGDGLRNAFNNFKYVNPATLPANGPYDKLIAECHSFGRVFLGAWYEMMLGIYEYHKGKLSPQQALVKSLDDSYWMVLQAAVKSPKVPQYTSAIAKLMVSLSPPQYKGIINKAFSDRQLIAPQARIMSSMKWEDFPSLHKKSIVSEKNSKFVTIPKTKSIKLSNYISGEVYSLAMGGHNLANVEVEVAADEYYEFDLNGNLIDHSLADESEIVESTKLALSTITSIGPYEDTMWEIKKGKLIRTHIA